MFFYNIKKMFNTYFQDPTKKYYGNVTSNILSIFTKCFCVYLDVLDSVAICNSIKNFREQHEMYSRTEMDEIACEMVRYN